MLDNDQIEKEILEFWKRKKTFDKLRKKIKGGKKWSFLDGPITANNSMGVHHAWGRTYKDLFQRFKAMQGFDQRFQNGFDCQGLWVEREEEKDLGLNSKEDIEKFGILNFVKSCRKRVEKFSAIQTQQSIRLGMWMDWDNSYYTMSDSNQLHNWYLLKKYHEKGWIYKGNDVVPWCPRCGTASSKHDIATEGYKEIPHKALFMQFPVKGKDNEYFLIFTTTPWTVPANVAIAVNADLDYVLVDNDGLKYWLAESRLEELNGKHKVLKKVKGKKLAGMEYLMPYAHLGPQKDAPHRVVNWDMASGEEGTGIVHIAPGCGAEDFELGKKEKLPAIAPLDEAGFYGEGYEEFSLKRYSKVNTMVLEDLEQRRFVYKIEQIKHRYPHCWRCSQELVFRLVEEWYVKHKEIKPKLIAENKKIKWYPEYGKRRQQDWFNNMGDWMISQKRYWGLPLPIWECECGHFEVFGSLEELKKMAVDKKKVDALPEIHRPWVDEIKIKCPKCKKEVERIKDLGMAWLDAGIVSLSTIGPYLENKKEWEKWFPADFITENYPGQYRGWFNALFWASVAITGKAPFKSIFGYETLKDEKGEEMHKSKGNAIWFDEAVGKIGADPIRLLYCLQDPSQELRFGFNVAKEPKNNLNILFNMRMLVEDGKIVPVSAVEDKWILSKLNSLVKNVTEELENLRPHMATRALKDFWLDDLSRGYIQFVRDRISGGDKAVKYVLKEVYVTLLKLLAPFIPFITEASWQDLKSRGIVPKEEESVHLCDWPKADVKKIDDSLETNMDIALKVIEVGLSERNEVQIGLKWPLAKATIGMEGKLDGKLKEIIKNQLNVKEIVIGKGEELSVKLDTKMTPELEAEGYAREVARKVQAFRRKLGLERKDLVNISIIVDDEFKKILEVQKKFLTERTNAKKLEIVTTGKETFKNNTDFQVKDKKGVITIKE